MINKTDRKATRAIRQKRVRTKVQGTSMRPRLCVFKSNAGIYAQVIDKQIPGLSVLLRWHKSRLSHILKC